MLASDLHSPTARFVTYRNALVDVVALLRGFGALLGGPEEILTASEAAAIRGCHRNVILRMCASGTLPAVQKPNGQWQILKSDVERLKPRRPATPVAPPDGLG